MTTEENVMQSYPLVITDPDTRYLAAFAKLYQLYYDCDEVTVIQNQYYNNHLVRIKQGKEEVFFPWLEFLIFEIVDLVNALHVETEGVLRRVVDPQDILKKTSFEALWEQLDDWASDLSLEIFDDDDEQNVCYVYKMFKNVEFFADKNKCMPKDYAVNLKKMQKEIDVYYAENLFFVDNSEEPGDGPGEDEDDNDCEINAGVLEKNIIPGTTYPEKTLELMAANGSISEEDDYKEDLNDDDDSEEDFGDRIELTEIKPLDDGIYTGT